MQFTTFFKFQVTLLSGLIIFTSCSDSGTKTTPTTSVEKAGFFYAVCEEKIPMPSHGPTGWCGSKRSNYDDVKKDTVQHNKDFPGHTATICSGSCPTCD